MAAKILANLTTFGGLEGLALGLAALAPACEGSILHRELTATPPTILPAFVAPAPTPLTERQTAKAMMERIREHFDYLKAVSKKLPGSPIAIATATQARQAWWAVWAATGFALPIPAACTGPDGQLLYSWDCGRHHLELEIISGRPAEFFYRDRVTGDLWGEDYNVGDPLPEVAVQKLKLFI